MSEPSRPTVKRLFALSGNRCSFPNCPTPLVDPVTGSIVGEICHIKGASVGSARYDSNQTDEERHGFGNLTLMCGTHHTVIDTDRHNYTVERLAEIKKQHESSQTGTTSSPDEVIDRLIANVARSVLHDQSLIVTQNQGPVTISQNQSGGQTAHQIINIGSQQRRLPQEAISRLVQRLRQFPPEPFCVEREIGDSEVQNLASQIGYAFQRCNWGPWRTAQVMGSRHGFVPGILILAKQAKPSYACITSWFTEIGFPANFRLDLTADTLTVFVGSNFIP